MGKIMKPQKVVLILSGRFAGRKAIVVKNNDEGSTDKPYGHALVVGVDRYPRPITKKMSIRKRHKYNRLKPFIKVYNYNHLMPTRYSVDIPFEKTVINKDAAKDPAKRKRARSIIKTNLEERYRSGKNKWFFQKLRF